jgi:hypothetical protein
MMYQFKQSLKIDKKVFPLGVHPVPAEVQKHPHFQKFLKAGSIQVAGASAVKKTMKDLPVLPPPMSEAAKRSSTAAKAAQVQPEAEIGEDQSKSSEEASESKKKRK